MEAEYRFQFTEEHFLTSLQRFREQLWWHRQYKKYRWPLFILYGLPILLIRFLRYLESLTVRKQFRKSPYHNNEIVIKLSESGMSTESEMGETRIPWKAITKARQFPDGLLLFQGPNLVNWFPHTAAVDPAVVPVALNLVRDRVDDFLSI